MLVPMCLAAVLASGCIRADDGVAITSEEAVATSVAAPPNPDATADAGPAAPGIVATSRTPIPPDAVTCTEPVKPANSTVAAVSDAAAPKVAIAVPEGWTTLPGSGDVGARMRGPDGMSATVTIAKTDLDPAEAFTHYADRVMGESAVASVSVLPAKLCGYSGQKLMGVWADTPQQSVEFLDRIAHIWTDTNNYYLVAVHVQAPSGTDEFDAASAVLISDFAVVIP
ncbi:hypothetical protein CQY20_17030 [Mycolicibacterium agri]|nr:hypothetical protein CQY20_17030 [Mycolicibacterium agri]